MKTRTRKWLTVTNEFVATFASKECTNCQGDGFVGSEQDDDYTVCACATLAFRRKYLGTPNVRYVTKRIGKRDYHRLEYKPLTSV